MRYDKSGPIKFRSGHYYSGHRGVPLGHHNDKILSGCGFSREDIVLLGEKGVVDT